MCVAPSGDAGFDRGSFVRLLAASSAGFALATGAAGSAHARDADAVPLPQAPPGMTAANARAAAIAARSPFVRATYAAVDGLAREIADDALRANVLELVRDPRPTYAARFPNPADRVAVRDRLARDGFVRADDPLSGIFPGRPDGVASQPFWSASGSGVGSHHAYPGGLCTHEYFNASIATSYAATYDRVYFHDARTIDRDTVIAAALYHDVMKTVVFQWRDDGTVSDELTIAGTGAHHTLSGAEAIARGRSPRFVITLLSAHAAPSLGDERKVVAWCRAAATIAGVDPVDYGLVVKDGNDFRLAPDFVPMEAFVNHLSDHDYVISVHAALEVKPELARLRARFAARDAWFELGILAHTPAIALYGILAGRGRDAFDREVDRVFSSTA